jgi:hypothetical protein
MADIDINVEGDISPEAAENGRLRRRMRDLVGADVAVRNEPRVIRKALEGLEPNRRHRRRRS